MHVSAGDLLPTSSLQNCDSLFWPRKKPLRRHTFRIVSEKGKWLTAPGRLSGVHNKPLMLSSHKVVTAAPPKPLRSFCFATCPLYTAPDLTSFFPVFQKQAAASVRWFSAVLVHPHSVSGYLGPSPVSGAVRKKTHYDWKAKLETQGRELCGCDSAKRPAEVFLP